MIKKIFYIFIILQIQCIKTSQDTLAKSIPQIPYIEPSQYRHETSQDTLANISEQTLGRVYSNIPYNGHSWDVLVVNVIHSTVETVLEVRSYMDRNQHHLFIYSDHPGYFLECKLQEPIKKDD